MKRNEIGSVAVILGGLVLSAQLYFLKIIQLAEMAIKKEWRTNAIDYAGEAPVNLALIATAAVIVFGFFLIMCSILEERKQRGNTDNAKTDKIL